MGPKLLSCEASTLWRLQVLSAVMASNLQSWCKKRTSLRLHLLLSLKQSLNLCLLLLDKSIGRRKIQCTAIPSQLVRLTQWRGWSSGGRSGIYVETMSLSLLNFMFLPGLGARAITFCITPVGNTSFFCHKFKTRIILG